MPQQANVPAASERPHTELPEKVSHNVSMRFKADERKFSGDTTEYWDEYVDNYRKIARDYKLSDVQRLQYLHKLLIHNAKRLYDNVVSPYVASFQQAVNHISYGYNLPIRQRRVKNYLHSLGINLLIAKGTEDSESFSSIYKIILKLSPQSTIPSRGCSQNRIFQSRDLGLREGQETLSRAAPHQLTYQ